MTTSHSFIIPMPERASRNSPRWATWNCTVVLSPARNHESRVPRESGQSTDGRDESCVRVVLFDVPDGPIAFEQDGEAPDLVLGDARAGREQRALHFLARHRRVEPLHRLVVLELDARVGAVLALQAVLDDVELQRADGA